MVYMSDLKEKCEELKDQRIRIIDKLKALMEDDKVKRYIELQEQNETLYNRQLDLSKEIKKEEYSSCEHVLVYS